MYPMHFVYNKWKDGKYSGCKISGKKRGFLSPHRKNMGKHPPIHYDMLKCDKNRKNVSKPASALEQ